MITRKTSLSLQQTDASGFVFFAEALPLAHCAYEKFVQEELQYSWHDWFQRDDWVVPIRHVEVEYGQPLYGGEEIEISYVITHVGNHSFTSAFTLVRQGKKAFWGSMTHVFCHKETGKKMPIPAPIRAQLNEAREKALAQHLFVASENSEKHDVLAEKS